MFLNYLKRQSYFSSGREIADEVGVYRFFRRMPPGCVSQSYVFP